MNSALFLLLWRARPAQGHRPDPDSPADQTGETTIWSHFRSLEDIRPANYLQGQQNSPRKTNVPRPHAPADRCGVGEPMLLDKYGMIRRATALQLFQAGMA
ncbi:hypothetical protein, partial [Nocardia neocaledoniensis]|uniref:hypothetical protein n=1 Tax=Nocardia neocaledoniensis TaxID=236511 RepID=UPI002454A370